KSNPQRQVLDERTGSGNAHAEQPSDDDFGNRQHDHGGKRKGSDAVFDRRENPTHFAGCCLRWASRAFRARSNMSFGTISPRIVAAGPSSPLREAAPAASVRVGPRRCISAIAAASVFGTSASRRFWTAAASARIFERSAGEIAFHAFFVTTVAPTTGA